MSHIQVIVMLRPEKLEGSDFDNIPMKITCSSWNELEATVDDFIQGYNRTTPGGRPIFDWFVAKDADILASMMVHEQEE